MDDPERFAAFRLALHWGQPDPEVILESLPARLLRQWFVFFAVTDEGLRWKIGDPDQYKARGAGVYPALKDYLLGV